MSQVIANGGSKILLDSFICIREIPIRAAFLLCHPIIYHGIIQMCLYFPYTFNLTFNCIISSPIHFFRHTDAISPHGTQMNNIPCTQRSKRTIECDSTFSADRNPRAMRAVALYAVRARIHQQIIWTSHLSRRCNPWSDNTVCIPVFTHP